MRLQSWAWKPYENLEYFVCLALIISELVPNSEFSPVFSFESVLIQIYFILFYFRL